MCPLDPGPFVDHDVMVLNLHRKLQEIAPAALAQAGNVLPLVCALAFDKAAGPARDENWQASAPAAILAVALTPAGQRP